MPSPEDAKPPANVDAHAQFETLLGELSSRFIAVGPGEIDREIDEALRHVAGHFDVDLAVLWQWQDLARTVLAATHVCTAQGDSLPPEPVRQEHYPYYVRQLLAGRLIKFSSMEELPAEAAVDVERGRRLGIKSSVCVPLVLGGEPPIGALVVNTLRACRDWPAEVVMRLLLVAQVFAAALARKRADQALRESEEVNRATFDQAAAGIAHVGTDGRFLRVNDQLCAIVDHPREELLQLTFQDITHPDDLETDLDHVRRVLSGEIKTYSIEKRFIRGDRSEVWATLAVSLVRTAAGQPRHFISVVRDITERKRADAALRASEARLAAGTDLAELAFYEVDFDTGAMYVDDRTCDVCGIPSDQVRGLQPLEFWIEHLHPDDRPRVMEDRQALHDGSKDHITQEYRYLHPIRGERWIRHIGRASRRDAAGRAVRAFGVLRDVTARKRTEDELRRLSRRLFSAHEEERALLARELHDDVTQRLAALAIEVGRTEAGASARTHARTMSVVREGLIRLSEDIHSLAYRLHPSVLEELGLAEALRVECERRVRDGGIVLSMDFQPVPAAVSKDAALCLYRVAQEALNNMVRHSGARAASVTLRQVDDGLLLAVRDEGVGFDPQRPGQQRSLGLVSMRERLRLVDGTLDIESAPGRGTAVIAWVPMKGVSP